ncbi:MAG: hypothetical protein E6K41_00390 [Gammaproteobacteria bacterium]|nr:MAG: hypothetical protein E6K41_00390 [Gammaproteobacteria bacterium]TLZ56076.1 MAG: hypothetical protein E6K22_02785 [Gammaproteobacteria bacterium]TLZ61729.1 MAG: hypothetical protein E6K20_08075 [Gammaproteobacteria bacterium]
MAASPVSPSPPRERRPAIWPYLLMPAVVLAVFYALNRVHHHQSSGAAAPASAAAASGVPRQL